MYSRHVRLTETEEWIISEVVRRGICENVSQTIRKALREFAETYKLGMKRHE